MDVSDFLAHYGKKGMRWGVRRQKLSRKEQKERGKRQKISKNRRTLSDADLKKYTDRLTTEKKLKDLIDADLKPGRTVVKKIMSESGQKVARNVVSGAAIIAVKTVVSRKMSPKGTKIKLDLKEVADTLARGSLKKK